MTHLKSFFQIVLAGLIVGPSFASANFCADVLEGRPTLNFEEVLKDLILPVFPALEPWRTPISIADPNRVRDTIGMLREKRKSGALPIEPAEAEKQIETVLNWALQSVLGYIKLSPSEENALFAEIIDLASDALTHSNLQHQIVVRRGARPWFSPASHVATIRDFVIEISARSRPRITYDPIGTLLYLQTFAKSGLGGNAINESTEAPAPVAELADHQMLEELNKRIGGAFRWRALAKLEEAARRVRHQAETEGRPLTAEQGAKIREMMARAEALDVKVVGIPEKAGDPYLFQFVEGRRVVVQEVFLSTGKPPRMGRVIERVKKATLPVAVD